MTSLSAAPAATALDSRSADVIILGGGPAGSTAGILLAERGFDVLLLDKDHHPRFHIGESLLPANLPLFRRLGIDEAVRALGIEKWSAEFVSPHHAHTQVFHFGEAWGREPPHAYQVRRSEFDRLLLDRARAVGCRVEEGVRAGRVELDDGRGGVQVEATDDDGRRRELRGRFLIDATGRDTLLANQLGLKRRNRRHNSAALYAHFTGAARAAGRDAGNITIFWFEHGWFWYIPLADGHTSVGAVVWPYFLKTRRGPLRDFFLAAIARCPPLAARLAGAELATEVEATGNYAYAATRTHGANYVLLGDAYAFIDPVFSSGVWLAMQSAVAGAEAVSTCLREPAGARRALRSFDRTMRHGPRQFSWFIYRITSAPLREFFMHPRNLLRMKEALLSLLAGDIYGDTPIWRSLRAFKGIYYLSALLNPRRSLAALRQRRSNIRDTGGVVGTP